MPVITASPTTEPTIRVKEGGASGDDGGVPGTATLGLIAVAILLVGGVAALTCRRGKGNASAAGDIEEVHGGAGPTGEDSLHMQLAMKEIGNKDGVGGCMNFLRDAGLSANRSASLSLKLSEKGYEDPSDFVAMDDAELNDDVLRSELGMLAPEIRKFRAAINRLRERQAGDRESAVLTDDFAGDIELGDYSSGGTKGVQAAAPSGGRRLSAKPAPRVSSQDANCIAFLEKINLSDIFPRIKAEAGGTVTLEDLCNPDFVSDKMLLDFELNKAQIRRFRRACLEHTEGASASRRASALGGAADDDGGAAARQAQADADAKAKMANTFGEAPAAEEGGITSGGGGVDKPKRLRPAQRRAEREAARLREQQSAEKSEKQVPVDQFAATIDADESEDPGTFL